MSKARVRRELGELQVEKVASRARFDRAVSVRCT